LEKISELGHRCSLRQIILWTVSSPFIVLILGIVGCEARKAYYDEKVRELCSRDGGIIIHKQLLINRFLASKISSVNGFPGAPPESSASIHDPAISVFTRRTIREGNPRITRMEQLIQLRSNRELLAQLVIYARSGGDFPLPAEPSYYQCPSLRDMYAQIGSVFVIEGEGTK
jgi:hypothetical protein